MTITDTPVIIDIDTITELKALVAEARQSPNFELVTGQARQTILTVMENGVTDSGYTEEFIRGAITFANLHMKVGDVDALQQRVESIVTSPAFDKVQQQARKTLLAAAAEGIRNCGLSFDFVEGACNIADDRMGKGKTRGNSTNMDPTVPVDLEALQARVLAIVSATLFKTLSFKHRTVLEDVALNGIGDHNPHYVVGVCDQADARYADFDNAMREVEAKLLAVKADPRYDLINGRVREQLEAGMPSFSNGDELTYKLKGLLGTIQFTETKLFVEIERKFELKIEAARKQLDYVNKFPRTTKAYMDDNPGVVVPTKLPARPTHEQLDAIFEMAEHFTTWRNSPTMRLGLALPGTTENNGRHHVRRGKSPAKRDADRATRASMKGKSGQKPARGKQG